MEAHRDRRGRTYFTRAEVARLFEVAPNTINRWVLAGRLPSVLTPGGRRRYPVEAILRLVRELAQGAAAPGRESTAPAERTTRGRARARRAGASNGRATVR